MGLMELDADTVQCRLDEIVDSCQSTCETSASLIVEARVLVDAVRFEADSARARLDRLRRPAGPLPTPSIG